MDKEELKSNLLKKLVRYNLYDENKIVEKNLCLVVDEFFGKSNHCNFLNDMEFFVLKSRLGLFNDGKKETFDSIINKIKEKTSKKYSKEWIRKIEFIACKRIAYVITRSINYTSRVDKMSSFSVYENKNNFEISNLPFSPNVKCILFLNDIKNIKELLTFDIYSLKMIGLSDTNIKEIYDLVHKLNLKTIEDLDLEERRRIIFKSRLETINNSAVSWIKYIDEKTLRALKKLNLFSIKGLKNYSCVYGYLDSKIIEYAKLLGIDISPAKKINSLNGYLFSIDDIMQTKIWDLDISHRTLTALLKNNLNTVNDIVNLDMNSLNVKCGIGDATYLEIVNLIHGLGLYFLDEVNLLYIYSKFINNSLESQKSNTRVLSKNK